MTTAVQHRRGTTAEHATFTGLEGEVTIDTTKDTAVIHDGTLAGGYPLAKENLANVNPTTLSTIDGASTASDDKFLIWDQSALTLKSITRAELNNAMEADALANVSITGGTINGTSIGATTASSGAFTTLAASGAVTLSGGTANGVAYLNGSKVLTTGSALTFDTNVFTAKGSNGGYSLAFDSTTTPLILKTNDITGASYAPLAFSLGNGSGSYIEQMRLTSTGLGIGTSSPGYKLQVQGAGAFIGSSATNNSEIRIQNTDSGGGTWRIGDGIATANGNLSVYRTSGVLSAVFDTSGNLGLGVTPSFVNGYTVYQVKDAALGSSGASDLELSANAYYNSGWKYKNTFAASRYEQYNGVHAWYTAPSGTAGNAISFTQAMTLDASGNLAIGQTSASHRLDIAGASTRLFGSTSGSNEIYHRIQSSTSGSSARFEFGITGPSYSYQLSGELARLYSVGVPMALQADSSQPILFATGGSERARITDIGNLLVGTTSQVNNGLSSFRRDQNAAWPLVGVQNANNGSSSRAMFFASSDTATVQFGVVSSTWTADTNIPANYAYVYGSAGLSLYSGGDIRFLANNTERARIDSSGNLLVGKTSSASTVAGNALCSFGRTDMIASGGVCSVMNRITNTGTIIEFQYANNIVGTISTNGSSTAYNTSSDYRLKENIQPMTGALERNALLKPCTYSWVADGSSGEGFIAHELQSVFSNAVTGEKDAVDANGNPVYQGVDTSFLVGHLVACIQELKAELDALKAKIG